jgi:hypothetical protein
MATTIPRTPWIDDDGSGTTGTVLNNAIKTELYNQIDEALATVEYADAPGVSYITTAGTITALPIPAGNGDLVIYMGNATDADIHGIAPGTSGQKLTLIAVQTGRVNLVHASASAATPQHRLLNFATSAPTSLVPTVNYAEYIYDATINNLWRLTAHDQGGWITAPYSAANFSAVGGMTWTVEAGDVLLCRYRLSGRTIQFLFVIANTSVGGTVNNALYLTAPLWGGFTQASNVFAMGQSSEGGGTIMNINGNGSTILQLYRFPSGNWTATTNTTLVQGQLFFDVT